MTTFIVLGHPVTILVEAILKPYCVPLLLRCVLKDEQLIDTEISQRDNTMELLFKWFISLLK